MILDVVSWLLRAALLTFVVAQVAVVVTGVRARRWIDVPEVTWTGLSRADAAQLVTEHLCHVRDGVFAFPAGTFAPHPDLHRARDGAVCVVENLPPLLEPLKEASGADIAEALLVLSLWVGSLPGRLLKVAGCFGGLVFLHGRASESIGFGIAGAAVALLVVGIGGWMAGVIASYLVNAVLALAVALLASVLLAIGYVLARGHRRLLRSRIDATVAQDGSGQVRIAIRLRGLGGYLAYPYVFKGLGAPRREPEKGASEAEGLGTRRATVLLLQAAGAAAVLVAVGLFAIV